MNLSLGFPCALAHFPPKHQLPCIASESQGKDSQFACQYAVVLFWLLLVCGGQIRSEKADPDLWHLQFYEESCLLDQKYVKDDSKRIAEVLKDAGKAMGVDLEIQDFVRFQCGEGLDKEHSNFADDVAQALQQTG